jgi:hypothetical protein
MELIKELGEKGIWLSITTRDLYYWAKVLNKIDELMNDAIKEMQEDAKNRRTDDAFMEIEPKYYENIKIMLTFTNHLLKDSSSRTIYSSVDVSLMLISLIYRELRQF